MGDRPIPQPCPDRMKAKRINMNIRLLDLVFFEQTYECCVLFPAVPLQHHVVCVGAAIPLISDPTSSRNKGFPPALRKPSASSARFRLTCVDTFASSRPASSLDKGARWIDLAARPGHLNRTAVRPASMINAPRVA